SFTCADKDGAGSSKRLTITWLGVSPSNGGLPVSISKNTTPRLQISVLASTFCPRACSGDIYRGVPITTPGFVLRLLLSEHSGPALDVAGSGNLANPKSSPLTRPSGRSITLAGLLSRCTIPAA